MKLKRFARIARIVSLNQKFDSSANHANPKLDSRKIHTNPKLDSRKTRLNPKLDSRTNRTNRNSPTNPFAIFGTDFALFAKSYF